MIELSPAVYIALCGLVQEGLMNDSDATPLLQRAAQELRGVTAGGMIPSELLEQPQQLESLRRAGMVGA